MTLEKTIDRTYRNSPLNTLGDTPMNTLKETPMYTIEDTPLSTLQNTHINNNSSENPIRVILVSLSIIILIICLVYSFSLIQNINYENSNVSSSKSDGYSSTPF